MSSHGSSIVPPVLFFALAIALWIAIVSVQADANALRGDPFGQTNEEFHVGYPGDHDTPEMNIIGIRERNRNRDRDRDRERNHVSRSFYAPYRTSYSDQMNADVPPTASKSFGLLANDRSAKRNIDEIDRTSFDNFFKRNIDEIDRVGWDGFAKRLADYVSSRTNKASLV